MNHVNIFETKTDLELLALYSEFLDAEKNGGFDENTELGKIKTEYEKDFGANTVIMTQIELTHTIADRWLKSCFESENDKISALEENKKLKEEINSLKKKLSDTKLEMSYMINPNAIGDRNDMGW
ncbi:hypothetical protein [Agathobacter rectalis]|uniref:Uncharacterized protein n=1 Tax=Agathobacter rectalis TaxID=39491 RepID=A0A3E4YL73_9FIRM|nr:hypothetical protein [Agathobacter rectalis]RGM75509.1 hypothetical protein DXB99_03005 [Agathobacter rectalis]